MNETQKRIDKAIANYSSSLMNSTKWREVLNLVGSLNMEVQFSFVRKEQFMSLIRFPEGGTKENATTDCTYHGPFLLKEIFEIRCPRFEEKIDPKTGTKYKDETKFLAFLVSLNKLGQLPINETETGVIISGYQK